MAILKCKMCGGDLNITADEKIVECEFCGTTQTIPEVSDEKKTNLFNRANRLRIANEFDKAAGIYESIIAEFPNEAESYWGLCLCKFGIEYVDDPKTAKKIPTCHRTSFESIFDDENYKMALEKSDVIAQGVYKEEATVIDNLQKDILSIVHKEEPFDVFICYKETDELGQRAQDSVLAQDIYDALTDKGFKVFFSRITLEDKLGKQYEPYIFAALNSAKVMLAIGTKEEYYNAVWVKNEWSRYLALMESDKSKMLIPCYRDIDPYDMPQEFKNLQGQDMSKLGFLQDLVRGISKIVAPEQNKPVNAEPAPTTSANATTDSLLKRAFMFLEDGNWKSAEEYCEKVLDINPECAEAYLGKLMSSTHSRRKSDLVNYENELEKNPNYQKILRFGNEALKKELAEYVKRIHELKAQRAVQQTYSKATEQIRINTIESHKMAISYLQQISDYKDVAELIEKSRLIIKKLEVQAKADAENARRNREYDKAIGLMKGENSNDYAQAMRIFQSLPGWKDSDSKKTECDRIIHELVAIEKAEKAEREKAEELARQQAEESARQTKLVLKIATPIFIVGIIFVVILTSVIIPNNKYNDAIKLMDAGEYKTAIARFEKLNGHKDSEEKITECKNILNENKYNDALQKYNDGNLAESLPVFFEMIDYKDSKNIIKESADKLKTRIATGAEHSVGLKADGTVVAVGHNEYGQCDVQDWTDIVAVSAGNFHTVGLKADGTVVATGLGGNGECDVSGWTDIVAISAGNDHTVGLKANGTVVAVGEERDDFRALQVSEWTDITAIAAGYFDTFGVKADGSVVATNTIDSMAETVSNWTNVKDISAHMHAIALANDGNVFSAGGGRYGEGSATEWKNIISIYAGSFHTVAINEIGSVGFVGINGGKCNFDGWSEIIAISSAGDHTIGLRADGSVIATGETENGKCNVTDWNLLK